MAAARSGRAAPPHGRHGRCRNGGGCLPRRRDGRCSPAQGPRAGGAAARRGWHRRSPRRLCGRERRPGRGLPRAGGGAGIGGDEEPSSCRQRCCERRFPHCCRQRRGVTAPLCLSPLVCRGDSLLPARPYPPTCQSF